MAVVVAAIAREQKLNLWLNLKYLSNALTICVGGTTCSPQGEL